MTEINRDGSRAITRLGEFRELLQVPYQGDDYTQAFRIGLRQEMTARNGYMMPLALDALVAHPTMALSYLETKLLRATMHASLDVPGFPDKNTVPTAWSDNFKRIFDSNTLHGQFRNDVIHRELQSNVSDRYKGLYATMALAQRMGRLTTGSVLDIGCSQNLGLKRFAGGYGFERPTSEDPRDAHVFSKLLATSVPLGPSIGIDREPLDASLQWARACSFNPAELLDTQKVQLFDELVASQPENLSFFLGDYTQPDQSVLQATRSGIQYDIVHWSTMMYMLSREQRLAMVRNARKLHPQFLVVQDFARVPPRDPRHISFRNNWQDDPMPYRTMVMDMKEAHPRWHELFLWQNGRAAKVALGAGAMALGEHDAVPAHDVIENLVLAV